VISQPRAGFKAVTKVTREKQDLSELLRINNDSKSLISADYYHLQDCPVFHALLCWGKLFLAISRRNLSAYIVDNCCPL